MKKILLYLVLVFTGLNLLCQISLGTQKKVFTVNSKAELEYRGMKMDTVLYYISGEVELKRLISIKDTASGTQNGKRMVFENGKAYEYKKITKTATGICDKVLKNTFIIRFEIGDGNVLIFKPEKRSGDEVAKYYLVSKGDNLTYGGYNWEILIGKNTYLYWKPKVKNKNKKSKDKVKGMNKDGSERQTFKDKVFKKKE